MRRALRAAADWSTVTVPRMDANPIALLARLATSQDGRTILVEDGKASGDRRSLAAAFAAEANESLHADMLSLIATSRS